MNRKLKGKYLKRHFAGHVRSVMVAVITAWTYAIWLSEPGAAQTINPPACGNIAHVEEPEGFTFDGCLYPCIDPSDPSPCDTCCPGSGGPGGSGPGGGCFRGCSSGPIRGAGIVHGDEPYVNPGKGMPVWLVSEPYVNLRLQDKPFWYQPSRGHSVEFELFYKSRPGTNNVIDTAQQLIFGVGTNWHTPWRSYLLRKDTAAQNAYFLYRGDGSANHLILDAVDYETTVKLTTGSESDTFSVTSNDGSRNIYGPHLTIAGTDIWLLSRMEDTASNAIRFEYVTNTSGIRLNKVIDVDSRETTFEYTNHTHYSNLMTKVNGPFGLTVILKYDSNARLTNVTDVVNLSSSLEYNASQRVSKLITPYGTNRFDYYSSSNWSAVRITELEVRKHLYLEGDGPTNLFPSANSEYTSLSDYVLNEGLEFQETFDNDNFNERNSYYWGPRQYENLSGTVKTKLDNATFTISDVTTNDYNKGHTRHWLSKNIVDQPLFAGSTLAMERAPSSDAAGNSEGLIIWYDHAGKILPSLEGFHKLPRFEAWRVSSSDWRVQYYEREWNGRVTKEMDNYGAPGLVSWRTNDYELAANHIDVIKAFHAGVLVSSNQYNAYHQVTTNVNALDEQTTYQYDGSQRLTNVTHPNGLITTYTYGTNGFLATLIDGNGTVNYRTNTYTYTNGLVRTHTDERGLSLTFDYDPLGRLLKTLYPDGTSATNSYDKLDLVKIVDRLGFTNSYEYNGFRAIVRAIDALNRTNTYQYCDCGSLDSTIAPLNNTNSFSYDNLGRRTRDTFPGGSYVDYQYNAQSLLVGLTNSLGASVTNAYTIEGKLFTATNSYGRIFYRVFDEHDQLVWSVNENGVPIELVYDALERITSRKNFPAGEIWPPDFVYSFETFYYTANIVGPTGYEDTKSGTPHFTAYEYDLLGRKTNEVQSESMFGAAVQTNRFTYYPAGNLQTLQDGKGQTTTWKYDLYGRLTNKLDTTSAEMFRYGYDANGRLTNRWSPVAGTTKYAYDKVGNLTSVDFPASTDITLSYDANNRLTNMVDATGTNRYTYTAFGALSSEDGPWDNDTVSYTYDNGRRRSGLNLLQPNASPWVQIYGYDAADRLTNVVSPSGAFGYTYHAGLDANAPSASALIKKLLLPNTATITNDFDHQGRLLGTYLKNSTGTALNQHTYSYNELNQRTRHTRIDASYVDYTYDDIGQLNTALGKESGGTTNRLHEQFRYTYDAAGNLGKRVQNLFTNFLNVNNLNELTTGTRGGNLTVAGTTSAGATNVTVNTSNAILYADNTFARTNVTLSDGNNTFTAIAKDNLGRQDTNAVTVNLPATVTFSYDLNGNLLTNGARFFEYDDENQLVRVTEPTKWKSEFTYDGKMRRRVRKEYLWQNSTWALSNEVRYVYDGNLVLQERDANNLPLISYSRGRDLGGSVEGAGGIGGLLARTDYGSQQHAYYYADANGNVTSLINTNQVLVAKYLYDPFGNILAMSGPLVEANLYRFSSKELHPASGLVYYLYRYYDPNLQRWLNRDPIHELGHQTLRAKRKSRIRPDNGNLYGFVHNNPISKYDPDGRWVGPVLIGGVGVGLGYCLDRLGCAARVSAALHNGESEADRVAPDGSTHAQRGTAVEGGDADALTHCIAGCNLGNHPYPCFGPDGALDRLQARETGNGLGTQLDRLNNEVGIGVGVGLGPGENCTDACLGALRGGLLNEINNGRIGPSSVQ